MRRFSITHAIRHAVLIAMAPACGQSVAQTPDASAEDSGNGDATLTDAMGQGDATDAGDLDAAVAEEPLPLPDGCVLTGKPDAFAPCGYTEKLNDPVLCQVDMDANVQDSSVCYVLCNPDEPDCYYYDLGDAGGSILTCGAGCIGRLHEQAREALDTCVALRPSVGDCLARAAMLEAASVDAFDVLARELLHHRAPADLAAEARRAAADEVRHARMMDRLARRHGRRAKPAPRLSHRAPRSLVAIAIENAQEGCVRETFGAALATWQGENATDLAVRAAMRRIARDECRHAELAWKIAAWANARLTARERARVAAAHRAALAAFERDLAVESDRDVNGVLGLPAPDRARALFASLRENVSA